MKRRPVYNVSRDVLERADSDRLPLSFCLLLVQNGLAEWSDGFDGVFRLTTWGRELLASMR